MNLLRIDILMLQERQHLSIYNDNVNVFLLNCISPLFLISLCEPNCNILDTQDLVLTFAQEICSYQNMYMKIPVCHKKEDINVLHLNIHIAFASQFDLEYYNKISIESENLLVSVVSQYGCWTPGNCFLNISCLVIWF